MSPVDGDKPLSLADLRHLKRLLEARIRTLEIIDAMGHNPVSASILEASLALEYVRKQLEARGY